MNWLFYGCQLEPSYLGRAALEPYQPTMKPLHCHKLQVDDWMAVTCSRAVAGRLDFTRQYPDF